MRESGVEVAARLVDGADSVTVLTGAGISTDSGIPDFRGPQGLWTKNPEAEKASNIRVYESDAGVRRANWKLRASGVLWADVEPNIGHHSLVHLQSRGKLHTLITQNVDELHQLAGTRASDVVEIHGTTRQVMCLSCGWKAPMEVALERVRAGDPDPHCDECGGLLKSATISFGQSLVPQDLARAEAAAAEADLFLAIGTSLAVFPVNETVGIAKDAGASVIIVNGQSTPYDGIADVVVRDPIGESLPRIVGMPT